jgi:hypothetical protein
MIEEKQRNEGLLGTIFFLMGYLRWGRGDNATEIQPIDFGKVVRTLDFSHFFPPNNFWLDPHFGHLIF